MAHSPKTFLQFSLLVTTTLVTPFFLFGATEAATLSLSPSTSKISEGGTFTVNVSVNTQGKAINNAEARVTFPSDLIEVTSINSGSSIFSLWAEQPAFSNASGAVTFNGGAVNPGYTGAGGRIFVITFKAKHAGKANLTLTGAAVRENDGLGTDILTGRNNATIEITGKVAPVAKPVVPKKEVPTPAPAPIAPVVKPTPPVVTPAVDTEPPRDVSVALTKNALNEYRLILKSTDLVGVDHYELTIDTLPTTVVPFTGPSQAVALPTLTLGQHQVTLTAYDKAGNKTTYTTTVQVDPTTAPVFTTFSPTITEGQQISVHGSTNYPLSPVSIALKSAYGNVTNYSIVTDAQGNFNFLSEPKQTEGNFALYAFMTNEQGVKGPTSQMIQIEVTPAPPASKSLSTLDIPAIPAIAVTIFAILGFLNIFGLYKFFSLKRRYSRMEQQSHKVFELLVLRANRQIAVLEDAEKIHGLNPTEQNALNDLKDVMAQLEHFDTPTK